MRSVSVFLMRTIQIVKKTAFFSLFFFGGLAGNILRAETGQSEGKSTIGTLIVEPYGLLGINKISLAGSASILGQQVSSESSELRSGAGLGLRTLGSFLGGWLLVGPDLAWSPSLALTEQEEKSGNPSISLFRIGGILGTHLPETSTRVWVGYHFLDHWSTKSTSGTNTLKGGSWKVGLGFSLAEVWSLQFEYVAGKYSSLEGSSGQTLSLPYSSGGFTLNAPSVSSFVISLSRPFDVIDF